MKVCKEIIGILLLFSLIKWHKMKIEILEFTEGAKRAKGVTVIIDVFRAFSVECYAYDAGVARIIATAGVEDALRLKSSFKNPVLVGERDEKKIEGFDFGNSPTEIIKTDLLGKTVIHTTTSGTQGLINALSADIVLTGSLVNAGALVNYIKTLNPEHVSLVAMGYRATQSAEEDLLCAEIISERLTGHWDDSEKRISALQNTSGKRFFNPENISFSPPTDFFLCTMIDKFNFVLKAISRSDGNVDLLKIDL
jgi:2-phosphosulfolactate phosphatase